MENNSSDEKILPSTLAVSIVELILVNSINDQLKSHHLSDSTMIRSYKSMSNIRITTPGGDAAAVQKPSRRLNIEFAGQSTRFCSMPNIPMNHMATEFECTAPMKISRSVSLPCPGPESELILTTIKHKPRSSWKRAKKFVRRMFCYAA